MPVPTQISDLSNSAAVNSPQGTESAKGTIDDYLRSHAAFIKQTSDLVAGATVVLPSAATVNIGFAGSGNISITGTTTITAFDTYAEGALRNVVFSGAMVLTHNATTLVLPGGANVTTASGDAAIFKSLGAGKWQCTSYQRSSGAGLGFTAIQQGTGIGQLSNTVKIGWSGSKLKATVDNSDLGDFTFFQAGTRMTFVQSAAPTGWVQDTGDTANNRMMRVVPGTTGGGVAGTHNPIYNDVVVGHTHGFTTGGFSSDHNHGVNDPGHVHNISNVVGGSGGLQFVASSGLAVVSPNTALAYTGIYLGGSSANHSHSGGTDLGSSNTAWAPRYVDIIICTKN